MEKRFPELQKPLRPGVRLKRLRSEGSIRLEAVRQRGATLTVTYRTLTAEVKEAVPYPEDLTRLEVEGETRFPWRNEAAARPAKLELGAMPEEKCRQVVFRLEVFRRLLESKRCLWLPLGFLADLQLKVIR